jgi:hypothetical protein
MHTYVHLRSLTFVIYATNLANVVIFIIDRLLNTIITVITVCRFNRVTIRTNVSNLPWLLLLHKDARMFPLCGHLPPNFTF